MLHLIRDILELVRGLLHHSIVIHNEILLVLYLVLQLLLDGVLDLILLNLVELHRVLHDLLYQSASVDNLSVHVAEEEFHLVQLLGHFLHTVAQAEHFGVLLYQLVACSGRFLDHDFVLIFALQLINLVILIIYLEHLIATRFLCLKYGGLHLSRSLILLH